MAPLPPLFTLGYGVPSSGIACSRSTMGARFWCPRCSSTRLSTQFREWQPVLEVLAATGLDDWQQWSWIMSPCSWLSDQVPAVVMAVNPEARARGSRGPG
ncbi:MAG: hypothetical protein R2710_21155 [Acidimicrobiales bacterium]